MKNITEIEPTFQIEDRLRREGYRLIAGIDEVGRGPLAGPVVAAAVILPDDLDPHEIAGVRDSKLMTEAARERLYDVIAKTATSFAAAHATPREIETLDIRKASLLAMQRAVENLAVPPGYALVDGRDDPNLEIPVEAVIKGDRLSLTIGAASIIAKVTRDRMMDALHTQYPHYGFDRHKGYPTQYHRDALQLFGACPLHRTTFAHVPPKDFIPQSSPQFRAFAERLMSANKLEKLADLEKEIPKGAFSELERIYLERRVGFMRDAAAKSQRQFRPSNVDLGAGKELLAAEYLQQKGYRLWERNFHCREGEIDLVVNRDTLIVFVEVKSRSSKEFGMPYEAVTPAKRRKIIRAADRYLYERGLLEGWDIRYDIVSILAPKNQSPQIEHIEDAFRVEGELD
jgi:ribonuclease HII